MGSLNNANLNTHKAYYTVKFYVDGSPAKELDTTMDSIRIVNRITNHYPLVFIDFDIDNQAFIENNFYPYKKLTMEIYYTDEDMKEFTEPLRFNLIILEMNIPLPEKYMYNISDKWEVIHQHTMLTCVPDTCHEIMNVTVNRMWEDPISVKDAVCGTIGELKFPKKIIDDRKINSTVLPQLLVPPMSFRNFLLYMDEKYGIYNGKLFFYMDWQGTFEMYELKRKFDDYKPGGGIYTVHKMPSYSKTSSTYRVPAQLARTTPTNYITYNPMETICKTNDAFIHEGGQQLHVFHPKYDISQLKVWDPVGKAESDGIHSNVVDLKVHNSTLKKRICVMDKTISDENCGSSDYSMIANYIDPAYKMNILHYTLIRKLKPQLMMLVGKPISIKPYAESEKYQNTSYEGEYMVMESILDFTRDQGTDLGSDTIFIKCDVKCCRTTQQHI